MSFELDVIVKATAILLGVAVLAVALRRASASVRHSVWATGLAAVLAAPLISAWIPVIELPILPASEPAPLSHSVLLTAVTHGTLAEGDRAPSPGGFPEASSAPVVDIEAVAPTEAGPAQSDQAGVVAAVMESPAPPALRSRRLTDTAAPETAWTWRHGLAAIWVLGALFVLAGWHAAIWDLRRLRRGSALPNNRSWDALLDVVQRRLAVSTPVELRIAASDVPPMTWGVFRHIVLLPASAAAWPASRLRMVLAHELAHVQRRDALGQILSRLACCLYWFHPLVWYASRRLYAEMEQACDDRVLQLGAEPAAYADDLFQIARRLNAGFLPTAVSMAHPSQLATRVKAILDPATRRQRLSWQAFTALLLAIAVLTFSIASIRVTALASMTLSALPGLPVPILPAAPPQSLPPAVAPASLSSFQAVDPANTEAAISGIVTNIVTGAPIPNAQVVVRDGNAPPGGPTPATIATVTADVEGRFTVAGLRPDRYALTATATRFVPVRRQAAAPIVDLSSGQDLRDLRLELAPGSVIAGRVFNADRMPLRGVRVEALRMEYRPWDGQMMLTAQGQALPGAQPAGTTRTDDRGEYRIFDLEPGAYYVRAVLPAPGAASTAATVGAAPVYYPGGTDVRQAAPLLLGMGVEMPAIDLVVVPEPVFSVRVKVEGNLPEGQFVSIRAVNRSPLIDQSTLAADNLGDGYYRFNGLMPGDYDIRAEARYRENDAIVAHNASTFIRIVDEDVDAGTLTLQPSVLLRGRILTDGLPTPLDIPGLLISLRAPGGWNFSANSNAGAWGIAEDGTFGIGTVANGHYWVQTSRLPAGVYLAAVRYGGRDVTHTGIVVEGDQQIPLEIVLASGGGAVEGVVRNITGDPLPGGVVALIPELNRRANPEAYFAAIADQSGRFLIRDILPGRYSLMAWEDIPVAAWRNAEFVSQFEGRGLNINVDRGSRNPVDIRVIPAGN